MCRFIRSLIALVAAYGLLIGAVFSTIASANSIGSDHFALCLAGAQSSDDPVMPENPRDHGLCCLICTGSSAAPALAPSEIEAMAPVLHRPSPWRSYAAELPAASGHGSAAPRAPPLGA
ncbi:MAG: hypothetical protein Q7S17_04130 [Xanthobacteraceae bacterium]|jgi:hypothetical protein|nr:hypothetical protein [Xanthobacteraceae bacterium]